MENKNIDKLFQEQLKNLEATPNEKVWNNIESKLTNKKRSILPFWWFSSGIAALLILGLILYPFSKDKNLIENNNNSIITKTPNKKDVEKTFKENIDTLILNKKEPKDILVAEENTNTKSQQEEDKKSKKNTNVVKNNTNKTEEERELVSTKNAMKKIFLADNSSDKKTVISKEKEIIIIDKKSKEVSKIIQKNTDILKDNSSSEKTNFNEFINKKDSVKFKEPTKSKWAIAPVFAVLKSNSFSNTSPIDENLANSTQGKNTFSYGVQVAYKINNKWTIQSGIHKQEISYANNQVIVATTTSNSSAVSFNNGNSFSLKENILENLDVSSNSLTNIVSSNGNLSQNYGYIEIPVEIKYNFSNNKKFETQLVAGFSSLFLNKNVVTLNTFTFSESVTAKNLNNINFSGNLGFDFNYFIDTNWSINLNPMFKAQLNTFSNSSNGFSPFNIGLYTGIKYTF